MSGVLLVVILALLVVAFLIVGNLARIAEAIEAQNRHYGIGQETAPEKTEAGA